MLGIQRAKMWLKFISSALGQTWILFLIPKIQKLKTSSKFLNHSELPHLKKADYHRTYL